MLISYTWLQEYFEDALPSPKELADVLSLHAFEVEGIQESGDDTIFDIDVLPNRSHDALSHDGMAREIGLLLQKKVLLPDQGVKNFSEMQTNDVVSLAVSDGQLVPRATKRLFTDVSVGESPEWLKERLAKLGQRSINNVVDITNLVMLETGQPVHAFDFEKITGPGKREVAIRGARKGEKVQTLDGEEWELEEGMLVIADTERALDIAGIKGGAYSGVTEKTTQVLLSACTFAPQHIRKTSRTLGLITDASKRFGYGISPVLIDRAQARAAYYLSELAGAKPSEDSADAYDTYNTRTAKPYKVGISVGGVNGLLGTDMNEKEVSDLLDRLVEYANFSYEKVVPVEKIVFYAKTLVGRQYKWGASTLMDAPNFFDCSSFINHVFVQAGIALPRMTFDQYVYGEEISKEDIQPGDVVFSLNIDGDDVKESIYVERLGYETKTGAHQNETKDFMPGMTLSEHVDHNGIYLGDGKVIHIARRNTDGVTIEKLSESSAFKNIVGYRRMYSMMDESRYVITVPGTRLDLRAGNGFLTSGNSEDVIEELGRVYGYYNIEAKQLPRGGEKPLINKEVYYANKIRDLLVSEGFSEVMTYSLVNEGEVELQNPFASDKSHMQNSLEEGLSNSLAYNSSQLPILGIYGNGSMEAFKKLKIFEVGVVFEEEKEFLQLGIVSGDIGNIEMAFKKIEEELGGKAEYKVFNNNDGGLLNLTEYVKELPEPRGYDFEDIDSKGVTYTTPSAFPFVLRDSAFWTTDASVDEAKEVLEREASDLLVRLDLFDTFEKEGRTSYAFHLVFQSSEKTLTDEEVNMIMQKVETALKEKGWEVR